MIELDDQLERDLRDLVGRVHGDLIERFESGVERLTRDAQSKWPEKTGNSKKGFEYGVRLPTVDRIEGYIRNTAENDGKPYAYLIKGKDGKPIWREWLEKPAAQYSEQLADEIVEMVSRRMGG